MCLESTSQKIRRMSTDKEKLIEKIEQTACEYEKTYAGCSRCVLAALQLHLRLKNGDSVRASTVLGGGVARTGEVCGALIGGLMGIGLIYGPDKLNIAKGSSLYEEAMERAGKLCDRFEKEFGSLRCRDIWERLFGRYWNLRDREVQKKLSSMPELHEKCASLVVGKAARLAADVILEP